MTRTLDEIEREYTDDPGLIVKVNVEQTPDGPLTNYIWTGGKICGLTMGMVSTGMVEKLPFNLKKIGTNLDTLMVYFEQCDDNDPEP